MNRMIAAMLKSYAPDNPERLLKAKFLLVSTFVAIFGLTLTLAYTSYTFGIQSQTVLIELFGFLIMLSALFFLIKGRYEIAGYIILTTGFAVVWLIIFLEPISSKLIKLDTIVFILVLIAAIPVMFFENTRPLIVYSLINYGIFAVFLINLYTEESLTNRELIDYASDSAISMAFIIFFSLYLFRISHQALNAMRVQLSERVRAESSLKEFRLFLSSIINSMPSIIIGIDENQSIVIWNQETTRITTVHQDEALGKNLFEVFPQLEFINENVKNVIQNSQISHLYKQACTWENRKFFMDITIYPLLYGSTEGAVLRMDDISEQIEMEEIMHRSEKMALVGQVAGAISHDFNNVLGIILGNAELSLLDCKDPPIRKNLELILEQTIKGKSLTRNLVAFAKDQEPKQEYFQIGEKIDLIIDLLRKDMEGIQVIKEECPDLPELLADPGMIEHAIINIIQNAIHATINTENPRIIIRTLQKDGCLFVEIEDNGCGIPEKYLDQIFEPLFTLKGSKDGTGSYGDSIKGTGYGMTNVKKYIDRHNGSVFVESSFGTATTCTIQLPIITKELSVQEKQSMDKLKLHTHKQILIVEDEGAISEVQHRILTDAPCHHNVEIANEGSSAMELISRNTYDLISLDYILPGKVSGMDVYHHIRKLHPDVPVLFVSGNIEFLESIKTMTQKDQLLGHQSKPCRNTDYLKTVNEMIERSERK